MNRGHFTSEILDYIWHLQDYEIGEKILDCGAGGRYPKMAVMLSHGYDVEGIEVDQEAIDTALTFAREHNLKFHLQKADMRAIPSGDEAFDGVYSYNTIFHMPKREIAIAVNEIKRVLKSGGLGFINFLGLQDDLRKTAKEVNPGEFMEKTREHGDLHTLLSEEECEGMLQGMEIVEKHSKIITMYDEDHPYQAHYIDYFFLKPKV